MTSNLKATIERVFNANILQNLVLIALFSNQVAVLTTLTLFTNSYQFPFVEIEPAIGLIGINVILQINCVASFSLLRDLQQFSRSE